MKTAVISGGAGGLGRALSTALQSQGWRVALIDRDISGLDRHPTQLPLQCDLTDPAQLSATMDQLLTDTPQIDLAIYNAGVTHIGSFADTAPDTHRTVFDINYFAAISMAHALLHPVRAARGTHLAISSVAGFAPLHNRTAYAASKHALQGFFTSLRSEERRHGVTVQIAAPSFVATNTGNPDRQPDGTARPGSAPDGLDYMSPEQAARQILRGHGTGRPMIPVGRIATAAWWINGIAPRLYQRLMERQIRGL
ncbi:SDR family NAD(P)-dependent oxidoreductase [Rhodobacteraceae bacterium M382]|nr:SDR family NAD(P)-dependent oxidoreductase [Rhodobacteraceae bacterium M382]